MQGALEWPPRKEDLTCLYLGLRLSAMKIAKLYGLQYRSPKTAESTVLYQLKRCGIKRRDPAEHVRKVTEEMVDEWVRRYEGGESLKQVAGKEVCPATVLGHLRRRGVVMRDKVEAQIAAVTKYERMPFVGSGLDRAYMMGLRRGDLDVVRHGRAVRARLSTTHPAMMVLFRSLFGGSGHILEYPKRSELTDFEWNLECDLDQSFSFLMGQEDFCGDKIADPDFLSFLAGFFDAEGSIFYHKKWAQGGFEMSITNTDRVLLENVASRLKRMHLNAVVRFAKQSPDRGVRGGGTGIWRLKMWRCREVRTFVSIVPMRHPEKTAKANIVRRSACDGRTDSRNGLVQKWNALMAGIRAETTKCIRDAEQVYGRKHADLAHIGAN